MAFIPDFDIDDIITTLSSASAKLAEGSKQRDAIELAQIALLYARHIHKEDEFVRYYKQHFDPLYTVRIFHEFSTRAEADAWLAGGMAEETKQVKIEGKGFMVVRVPGRLAFMVAPLPEEMDSDEWKDNTE